MSDYPARNSHHAHKLTRLLFKSCALQDLSRSAVLLVIHVAHQEDTVRYRYPIRFWNIELYSVLGFHSPKQLNDARREAVEAGWLHYERGHDRAVGIYWSLIPDKLADMDDAPIGHNSIPKTEQETEKESRSENGKHSENGTRSGTGSGTGSGKPSSLSLNSHTHANGDKIKGTRLDTESFRDAWGKWQQHIAAKTGKRKNDIVEQVQLAKLAGLGVEKATRDVLFSIEHDALNLLDSDNDFQKRGSQRGRQEAQVATAATAVIDIGQFTAEKPYRG